MTTRNFDIATHMGEAAVELPDIQPTNIGDVLVVANMPTGAHQVTGTKWLPQAQLAGEGGPGAATAGATLPAATEENQLLVSGQGPGFNWKTGNLDSGNY